LKSRNIFSSKSILRTLAATCRRHWFSFFWINHSCIWRVSSLRAIISLWSLQNCLVINSYTIRTSIIQITIILILKLLLLQISIILLFS